MKTYRVFKLATAEEPASVILKLVGETCNLDCGYCYEKRKPYEGSRILQVERIAEFLMSLPPQKLAIELHGGEPLLYPEEEFERLGAVLRGLGDRVVRVTIQTNGTLLSEAMLQTLVRAFPMLQLGISIDGPDSMNDQRVDLQARPSIDGVLAALDLCACKKIDVGAISVVTRQSLGQSSRLMSFFAELPAVKVVKLVPCFDSNVRQDNGPSRRKPIRVLINSLAGQPLPWSITPNEYAEFVCAATDYWADHIGPSRFLLEPTVSALRALKGVPTSNCHFGSKKCSHVYTLYPDGTVGSCDELERRSAEYGSINGQEAFSRATRNWGSEMPDVTRELLEMCETCDIAESCGGGCIASRRRMHASGQSEAYCRHRRLMLSDVARIVEGSPK